MARREEGKRGTQKPRIGFREEEGWPPCQSLLMRMVIVQTGMLLRAKQVDKIIKLMHFLKHCLWPNELVYYIVLWPCHRYFSEECSFFQYGLIILCFVIKSLAVLLKVAFCDDKFKSVDIFHQLFFVD